MLALFERYDDDIVALVVVDVAEPSCPPAIDDGIERDIVYLLSYDELITLIFKIPVVVLYDTVGMDARVLEDVPSTLLDGFIVTKTLVLFWLVSGAVRVPVTSKFPFTVVFVNKAII